MKAVIFDLNGTVVDDEENYGYAFKKVLMGLGKRIDKKIPHTLGIGVKENWPLLLAKYKVKTNKSVEELARETQDEYLKRLSKIQLIKGFDDFTNLLKEKKMTVALATSNSWWIADN